MFKYIKKTIKCKLDKDSFIRSQYPESFVEDVYALIVYILESNFTDSAKIVSITGTLNGIYSGFSEEINTRLRESPVHRQAMISLGYKAYEYD